MPMRPSKSALVISLAAAGAAALGACNVIVGTGDFAVGPAYTGSDASVGDDDANLPGDDASPIDSSAVDGGDANVACGDGLPTTPAFDQVVKACILWAGCTGRFTPVSVSNCIAWDWFGSNTNDPQFPCLAQTKTCAEVTACLGEAWATKAQCAGTGAAAVGTCSGSTAINCKNGQGVTTNCAKYAGTTQCGVHTLANDAGSAADCIVEPTCKSDAGTDYVCDTAGNFLYSCVGGVGYGASCAPSGYQCATFTGDTDCWIEGPKSCTGAGAFTCTDDKTMSFCTNTLTSVTLHCGTAGGSCVSGATATNCVSPGCTAAQQTACKESCESDRYAHLCVGGAPLKVDCKTYADFTGCVLQSNGDATCVP